MATDIFVDLPVNDLKKSIESSLPTRFHIQSTITDDTATCMVVSGQVNDFVHKAVAAGGSSLHGAKF
jgi:predicted lactoylglutathione lyase